MEILDEIDLRIDLVRKGFFGKGLVAYIKNKMAQARREAFEEAVKIAEKRADELLNLYTMHNGEHDVRGGVAAGEVGLLIQQVINNEKTSS